MKKVLTILAALPLLLAAQTLDVLSTMRGASGALKDGAEGLWEKSASQVKFTKNNSAGYIIYAGNSKFDPAITPGKLYEAAAEFEISGNASGALMLSMPGGKRRPFPIETLKKSGRAVITFTARADEKQVNFHAVVRGEGEVILKSMTLKELNADDLNLLTVVSGSSSNKDGAEGKAVFRNGKITITKTNDAGYILWGNNHKSDLDIVPGETYTVTANLQISGNASGTLMISMPGGKRRPFPIRKISQSGQASIQFSARNDERKLRLHIVARGEGEVICDSITVKKHGAAPQSGTLFVNAGDRIAFLGDSITKGGNRDGGYINLVMDGLRVNGIAADKIPAGVSGNKSNQMLARLDRDVLSKKPQIMLLSCGVNDVWHGARGVELPEYKQNITAIVEKAQAAGVKVVILTATMIREDAGNDLNKKLVAYNEFLRELAKEKKCLLVDLNAAMQREIADFKAANPGVKGNILTVDGVHMNPKGNMMMAKNILRGFGLSDAQIAVAEKEWMKTAVQLSDRITLTIDEYCRLTRKAAENGQTFAEYATELLKNSL